MTNEYVTRAELAAWLGIVDSQNDQQLDSARVSASRAIDRYTARRFYKDTTATKRIYNPYSVWTVDIDDVATTSGLIVQTDDNDDGTADTTWSASDYITEPLNGVNSGVEGWPITRLRVTGNKFWPQIIYRPAVHVTAIWGWAAIPEQVKQATLIVAADLYKQKDSPFGVAGFGDFGAIRMRDDVLARVRSMLAPFRRDWGIA
jgi:hypothetical protein